MINHTYKDIGGFPSNWIKKNQKNGKTKWGYRFVCSIKKPTSHGKWLNGIKSSLNSNILLDPSKHLKLYRMLKNGVKTLN